MKMLPSNLKTKLYQYIYSEAIRAIVFLQNRHYKFYEDFLDKLKPLRKHKGDIVTK